MLREPTSTKHMMAVDSGSAPVKWTGNGLQVGSIQGASYPMVGDYWWPQPEHHHHHYTTTVTSGWQSPKPNPTEMAFKIVAKLMEDGIVEELTVKKFVKLVDDVAKIVKES
jgi:hypothetical protein